MKDYVLLTPGPLSTSHNVKQAMLHDVGTRDQEYQRIVENLRATLLKLAHAKNETYACILLQGSGTYGVESVLTSTITQQQKVLILSNGSYGERMEQICQKAHIPYRIASYSMIHALPINEIEKEIAQKDITHVAYIHCETTAGVLNDIHAIQQLLHKHHKISIVDAMSSFASMDISMDDLAIDYLITSSNKCLHGVPGIAIVIANKEHLNTCKNICPSLSLDLYEQFEYMEQQHSSFRFTSPTHVLLALCEAIKELQQKGGIPARQQRYQHVQKELHKALKAHGFQTLVNPREQSYVITTFLIPKGFNFSLFYAYFKEYGFLLYRGKLPNIDAFRIGNIGEIEDYNIQKFIKVLGQYMERLSCK